MSIEDSVGLGNHIRHDAITGDAEESEKSFHCSRGHTTVFVTASAANKDTIVRQSDGIQNTSNQYPTQKQPCPAPPPHPSLVPNHPDASLSALYSCFPPPPPHPLHNAAQSTIPFPPPRAPVPQQNLQPASLQIPPPPGLPPQFPPLANAYSGIVRPPITTNASSISDVLAVPSQHLSMQTTIPSHSVPAHNSQQNNSHASSVHTQTTIKEDQCQAASEQSMCDPIERARAIARRFHVESTQRQTPCNNSILPDNSIPSGINYLEKRQAHFQKEKVKLNKFRLKNLEYVMRHDEMELRRHVDSMNRITAFEEKQSIQMELAKQQQRERQAKLELKRQQKTQTIIKSAGGGIGSREQQRAEKFRKREHLEQGTSRVTTSNGAEPRMPQRNAIYLTNLPTDGSTTERILHSLFSSYGRLDRVTMYRNRSTGELKGDGLIVFGKDALVGYNNTADGDLIDAVCLQVSNILYQKMIMPQSMSLLTGFPL